MLPQNLIMEGKYEINSMDKDCYDIINGQVEMAKSQIFITEHKRTLLIKSISLFLGSGRRKFNVSKKMQLSSRSIKMLIIGNQKNGKIPVDPKIKNIKIDETLIKKTKFSKQELQILCKIYNKLTTKIIRRNPSVISKEAADYLHCSEGIDRTVFREILYNIFNLLIEDTLIERMFSCWDRDNDGTIKLESWIRGLNLFLCGNLHEKMEFCFKVYDLNNDGFITKDEIFQLFKNCFLKQLGEEDHEENVKDLSEITLNKLDIDQDGKISFNDYKTIIQKEELLLEVFGQVLPTVERITAFLLLLRYI